MKAPVKCLVTLVNHPDRERPWTMYWSGPHHLVQRTFVNREEAIAIARAVAVGPAPFTFKKPIETYPASEPVSMWMPSSKAIETMLDVCDALLSTALEKRGVR